MIETKLLIIGRLCITERDIFFYTGEAYIPKEEIIMYSVNQWKFGNRVNREKWHPVLMPILIIRRAEVGKKLYPELLVLNYYLSSCDMLELLGWSGDWNH